jgi:hypothetical protein
MLSALLSLGAMLGVVNNSRAAEKGDKGAAGAAGAEGPPGVGTTVIYGYIAANGVKQQGSAGFTSEKLAAGRYKINKTVPFAALCIPTANLVTVTLESWKIYVTSFAAGSFEVRVVNAAGALADLDFTFHCFGV